MKAKKVGGGTVAGPKKGAGNKKDAVAPNGATRETLFGLPLAPWTAGGELGGARKNESGLGRVIYQAAAPAAGSLPPWLEERMRSRGDEVVFHTSETGPVWIVRPRAGTDSRAAAKTPYAKARDLVGMAMSQATSFNLKAIDLELNGLSAAEMRGALVGAELASYRFLRVRRGGALPKLRIVGADSAAVKSAADLGLAINVARHLVNLPAAELTPASYADALHVLFRKSPTMTVEVLAEDELRKEKCGLLLGVGQAAVHGPRLVHLSYRPKTKKGAAERRPIAFVGKGVTFDTGGLDIKPADGMRLMKKDMGGSATLAGLALWLDRSGLQRPCDIYLALAENAIGDRAFRPGDVLTARSGLTVEIHNTDAEGRLVMADALDYALTEGDDPELIIDVATLTGAMRVALGTTVAGLLSNHDDLSADLLRAAARAGEAVWRMPLFDEYAGQLQSQIADIANASSSRNAGGITAALFLKRFVRNKAWAHFDAYCWADRGEGALSETGGNGQVLQTLAAYLSEE